MANKINKVIDRNGNTLIDLTNDTITPNKVLSGTKFHGADGKEYTGSLSANELDTLKYTFIDYDGTVMYTFTDEEIDAMQELPAGPNHTDENLTFQEWNWSLADLKAWNRTRTDRPIVGANLITTDRKSYLYLNLPFANRTLSFERYGTLNSVDWGDGTVNTSTSHTYTAPGEYTVVIDMAEGGYFYFSGDPSTTTAKQFIERIKLGNIASFVLRLCYGIYYLETINIPVLPIGETIFGNNAFASCRSLKAIVIPNGISRIEDSMANSCYLINILSIPNTLKDISGFSITGSHLKHIALPEGMSSIGQYSFRGSSLRDIIIPDSVTTIEDYSFYDCKELENFKLPDNLTNIGSNLFYNCSRLKEIKLPKTVTSIGSKAFQGCYSLKKITIPDSVTNIGSSAFSSCYILTLDLSEQTKVITLTSDIGLSTNSNKILVPAALLDAYKSASYWSKYASIMVGV